MYSHRVFTHYRTGIFLATLCILLNLISCGGGGGDPPPPVTELDVSSNTLDFGVVSSGSTTSQIVTLTNTGTVPVTGISGGTPGDNRFTLLSTCLDLQPGDACTYTYTYQPTTNGVNNTTSISSTSIGTVQISLTGVSVGSDLWVSPLALDFGPVTLSVTSPVQTVTITNLGTSTLGGFAGGAPFDNQFNATQNCAAGVPPGGSCQYFVTFTPNAVGTSTTTSNSVTNAGPFIIELTGTGVGAGLHVTPSRLDFGPVIVGNTSPQQIVTITNTGPVTLENFAGGAPFDNQFGASQNCAAGVAPGASCQYFITFTPNATGTSNTTSNSSTNAGPFVIELTGTGVSSSPGIGPGLWVTPQSLDFGEVALGQTSAQQIVTITNTGDSTLTNFAGGAPFDNQFNATQNCAAGVPPGGSCQYFVTFTPNAVGTSSTTSNSSTNAGSFVINLTGTGIGPELWVTPTWLDFSTLPISATSATQTVTITNTGLSTLTNFAGGAPLDNQFNASQNCASGVAPGASCQYFINFSPTSNGFFETESLSSTNAGSFSIQLQGGAQ